MPRLPDTPGRLGRPVSFADFGLEFVRTVMSRELLQKQFLTLIPPYPVDVVTPEASGTATPKVGQLREGLSDRCCLRYTLPLEVVLDLVIEAIPTTHNQVTGSAHLQLSLEITAHLPATLFLNIAAVTAADVEFDPKFAGYWEQLARPIVQSTIREKIAERIQGQLDDSVESRTLDLPTMLLSGVGKAEPATPGKPWLPVGAEAPLRGRLAPGSAAAYRLLLRARERVTFTIYLGNHQGPQRQTAGWAILGASGRALPGTGSELTVTAWPPDFDLNEETFTAAETGTYGFRLTNLAGQKGTELEYLVLQTRQGGEKHGPQLCFDEFGVQFMRQALSPAFFAAQLELALAEPIPEQRSEEHGIVIRTAASAHLRSVAPAPLAVEETLFELAYRVTVSLELLLHLKLPLLEEQGWRAEADCPLVLRVYPFSQPAAIHVEVDPVSALDPTLTHLEHVSGPALLTGVERTQIEGSAPAKIAEALNAAFQKAQESGKLHQVIAERVQELIAGLQLPPPPPPSLKGKDARTFRGHLRPGAFDLHPVRLRAGQTVKVGAQAYLEQGMPFGWQIASSVALLDAHQGLIAEETVLVSASGRKRERETFTLRAAAAGDYWLRVRAEPASEDYGLFHYTLKVG